MATLDKIFCTTAFEQQYPLAFVSARPRVGSDHVPLVLILGIKESKKTYTFQIQEMVA
jgi:endonuclease/exonuclease/phosphatase family metal-dependent hydrolase